MLEFVEREQAGRSSLAGFSSEEEVAGGGGHDTTYHVETVSLLDALRHQGAPSRIDYLSVDTEGSELAILEAFNFSAYRFSVMTCEHNLGANRERIHHLLHNHGYRRVHEELSQFDDWYVDSTVLPEYVLTDPSMS